MNRLNRKCFLASAVMHGVLFLVLLVGPAFFISREQVPDLPTLDILDAKAIDEAFFQQAVSKPAPTPPTPSPTPPPVKQPRERDPDPPPEVKNKWKAASPDEIRVNRQQQNKTVRPQVTEPRPNDAEKAADRISAAVHDTTITVPKGSVSYANHAQLVKSAYAQSWRHPGQATSDHALARVEVVIARDGRVLSAKLISRSGDPAVDASVQDALNRVTQVAPFPDGASEQTRTYTIGFSLKVTR